MTSTARITYTARCPACGADAEFVSVGDGDGIGGVKRLARVEVNCPCPPSA